MGDSLTGGKQGAVRCPGISGLEWCGRGSELLVELDKVFEKHYVEIIVIALI
jgi:hypothetical protein